MSKKSRSDSKDNVKSKKDNVKSKKDSNNESKESIHLNNSKLFEDNGNKSSKTNISDSKNPKTDKKEGISGSESTDTLDSIEKKIKLKKEQKELKEKERQEELQNFVGKTDNDDETKTEFSQKEKEFELSFGNINDYLDLIYVESPILLGLIKVAIILIVFNSIPFAIFWIDGIKDFNFYEFIAPKGAEKSAVLYSLKAALYISACYSIVILENMILDNLISILMLIFYFFDVNLEGFVIDFLVVVKNSSSDMKKAFIAFSIFYLTHKVSNTYVFFAPKISIFHFFHTLCFWYGCMSVILFFKKLILNYLTTNLRKASYKGRIWDTNYKTFIFKKLDLVAEAYEEHSDVDWVIKNISNNYDSGSYLKYTDLKLDTEERGNEVCERIFSRLKVENLNYQFIMNIFPDNYNEVSRFLNGQEVTNTKEFLINKEKLQIIVYDLAKDRNDLNGSLKDRENILEKLNYVLTVIIYFFGIIILMILLDVNYKIFFGSIGPVFVSLSWIFQDNIKDLYKCFVFHLASHVYDCGDRVIIGTDDLIVKKVDLLYTEFLNPDNRVVFIPTVSLLNVPINNVRRSKKQFEQISIDVSDQTPYKSIISMRNELIKELQKYPNFFTGVVKIRNVTSQGNNSIVLVALQHKYNFQILDDRLKRRELSLKCVENSLKKCNISYSNGFVCVG